MLTKSWLRSTTSALPPSRLDVLCLKQERFVEAQLSRNTLPYSEAGGGGQEAVGRRRWAGRSDKGQQAEDNGRTLSNIHPFLWWKETKAVAGKRLILPWCAASRVFTRPKAIRRMSDSGGHLTEGRRLEHLNKWSLPS